MIKFTLTLAFCIIRKDRAGAIHAEFHTAYLRNTTGNHVILLGAPPHFLAATSQAVPSGEAHCLHELFQSFPIA